MNSSSLTRSHWFSNVGESMSSQRRWMTSSLVMLRTSFAMCSVSMLDRWLMISVVAASAAAAALSSSKDQLVWLGAGDVSLHPLKGSRQSLQVLWCLSHLILKQRCTYCLQQGSWTLCSQVSDFRWHTKHWYSLVTTSGSSYFSLLLCRSSILFFLHKYKIYNQDGDERHMFTIVFLWHVWYLFRFLRLLAVMWLLLFDLVHSRFVRNATSCDEGVSLYSTSVTVDMWYRRRGYPLPYEEMKTLRN